MKVKDIMTKNVAYISPEATVTDAARLMQKHNVGSIPRVMKTACWDRDRQGHCGKKRGPRHRPPDDKGQGRNDLPGQGGNRTWM